MAVSERAFGVEIEHNLGGGWERGRSDIDRASLIVREIVPHWFTGDTPWRNRASVGADGSGVELRTPILQGEQGLDELRAVMDALVENGGNCTAADGMHVHFDAPEFVDNGKLQASLVQAWLNCEPAIERMVARRRIGRNACPKNLTPRQIELLRKYGTKVPATVLSPNFHRRDYTTHPQGGRGALNLRSIERHGSIEIRLHEGTVDSNVATAWVQFGQNFIDTVARRKRAIPRCTLRELLSTTKVDETAAELLVHKAGMGGEFAPVYA